MLPILHPRRQQSQAAWILAKALLPAGDWTREDDERGRPSVKDARGAAGPDVSVTHSRGWCAAIVGDLRVGIDLEVAGQGRNWPELARASLSHREALAVEHEGEEAFLAFWTLREAIAKLGNDGLSAALALDGDLIVAGRNGACRGPNWVAAHRHAHGLHLALAWVPSVDTPDADRCLLAILLKAMADCGGSFKGLPCGRLQL